MGDPETLQPLVREPVVDPNLPLPPTLGDDNGQPAAYVNLADGEVVAGRRVETLPTQPVIPELVPAFDFRAAFESIIERRGTVRLAQEHAETTHAAYARAKKRLDEEQKSLSALEDVYAERARLALESGEDVIIAGDAVAAIRLAARRRRLYLSAEEAAALVDDLEVRGWLQHGVGPQPETLGRCHVVTGDVCRDCGALFGAPALEAYGLDNVALERACVGVDCPGPPPLEDEPTEPARRLPKRHKGKPPSTRRAVAEKPARNRRGRVRGRR